MCLMRCGDVLEEVWGVLRKCGGCVCVCLRRCVGVLE